ncbi:hypothetical protein RQP46_005123 [Phenoliferia psychrophenolica]
MSASFLSDIEARRSVYTLAGTSAVPNDKILEIVRTAVKHCPTAFNTQSSRAIVLVGNEHLKAWDFVLEGLWKLVSEEEWPQREKGMLAFRQAYGTVLLFEDTSVVPRLEMKTPAFAKDWDTVRPCLDQAHGMLAFAIWTAFSKEGLGCNLQHPLLSGPAKQEWGLPESWELMAQLVFGDKTAPPFPKHFK